MTRYFVFTEKGHRIIYGDYFKALSLCKKGYLVKSIPSNIDDDDIIYCRVTYNDL